MRRLDGLYHYCISMSPIHVNSANVIVWKSDFSTTGSRASSILLNSRRERYIWLFGTEVHHSALETDTVLSHSLIVCHISTPISLYIFTATSWTYKNVKQIETLLSTIIDPFWRRSSNFRLSHLSIDVTIVADTFTELVMIKQEAQLLL